MYDDIETLASGPFYQGQATSSPPLRLPSADQTFGSMPLATNCSEQSAITRFTPPGWRLDAVVAPPWLFAEVVRSPVPAAQRGNSANWAA